MFQSVRPNSQIYIFHKSEDPKLDIGYITNQPIAKPKYAIPTTFGQPQEMVVDLVVKVDDKIYNFNSISANSDIADSYSNGENIIITDSRDAMNSEILSLKQKSTDIINSIPLNEKLIKVYDSILSDLNPEFAEKQAQRVELDGLKNQVSEMSKSISELMETNKALIERLSLK